MADGGTRGRNMEKSLHQLLALILAVQNKHMQSDCREGEWGHVSVRVYVTCGVNFEENSYQLHHLSDKETFNCCDHCLSVLQKQCQGITFNLTMVCCCLKMQHIAPVKNKKATSKDNMFLWIRLTSDDCPVHSIYTYT